MSLQIAGRRKLLPWFLSAALGLALTVSASLAMRAYEQSRAAENFSIAASERISQLGNSIDLALSQVNALGIFLDAAGTIDRSRFHRLAQPLVAQAPSIEALAWVPRVWSSERAGYVANARRDGYPDFEITRGPGQGKTGMSRDREVSFPVYYVEPLAGHQLAFGLDLTSHADRKATLESAMATGSMKATGRIVLVQDKRPQYGFLVARPVYTGGTIPASVADRQARLAGYALGEFRVADIVEKSAMDGGAIRLALFDSEQGPSGEKELLYSSDPADERSNLSPSPFRIIQPLEVAGRRWVVMATPGLNAMPVGRTASTATLLLGLLMTGLLAIYLRERENRMAVIEATVDERTRELDRERLFSNAVFDTAGGIILVINRAAEIVRFNAAAQAYTGYSFEEVRGQPYFWKRFLLPEQRNGVEAVFKRFRERALPSRYVNYWIGRDGGRRLFDWTNTFLSDEQGEPEYLVTVGLDITERVQVEASLRDSEAQFRQFFEHNNASMLLIDPQEGAIMDANDAACKFYGWTREAFRQRKISQINTMPPDKVKQEVDAAMAESRNHFVFEHRLADGSVRIMEIHSTPVKVGGKEVLFSILHDITEREQALAALREESNKNRALLMNSVDGIHILDQSGFLVEANDAFLEMLGYERTELIGRHVSVWDAQWSDSELSGKMLPSLMEARRTFETLHLTKDGRILEVEVSTSGVQIGAERVLYCASRDISERNRINEALHESEVKFHTMVDWTYDWEYWIGPDGRFVYITPSVERVTGYGSDRFTAVPALLDEIVHPEDRHRWGQHIREHMPETSSGDVGEIELRIVRLDGEVRWVNHICRSVIDEAGRYRGRRVAVRDITERKRAEDEIRHLAYFDPLTQLPNRRLLMDRLGQALIATRRSKLIGALMIMDLDHFKTLNDTQGHDIGDQLLVEVANRLRGCVRQEDTVARLGGDEFVIMVEGLGNTERGAAGQAEVVAEKIRAEVSHPYVLGGSESEYVTTPSIGLTLFVGEEHTAEVLLKQADVALYQAKDAGRNRVRFFNPAMQAAIDSRAMLENALRRALERDEFRLYYQPQVDSAGRVIGVEALLRWLSPEQGLVLPAQFIPLAEETGLILQLGDWVLRAACRQLREWADRPGTDQLEIAVNVSARQFRQPDFVEQVRQALAASGADPSRLKLELTETVLLDSDEFISHMQQLDGLGVKFSLDDFGTGYSSLSYLKRLPIDQLKIDQVFIRDVNHDPNDAAIVRAILAMSESLGFDIIAEGVETEEQYRFLLENGCRSFQGYLYGKPMPVEDLAQRV